MSNLRATSFSALIIVAVLVSTGCQGGTDQQALEARAILRVGYSPLTLNAPLFIALEEGLFPGEVETQVFQSTNDMFTALAAGRIDLASAATTEAVIQSNSKAKGLIKSVVYNVFTDKTKADAFVHVGDQGVSCSNLTSERYPSIATYPAQSIATYLSFIFGDDVEVMPLPPSAIFESLGQGVASSAYLLEPQVSVAVERDVATVVCWSPVAKLVGSPAIVGSHAVNTRTLQERGWSINEVQQALWEGAEIMTADRAAALPYLVQYTGLPADLLDAVGYPAWLKASSKTLEDLKRTCNLLMGAQVVTSCKDLSATQPTTD